MLLICAFKPLLIGLILWLHYLTLQTLNPGVMSLDNFLYIIVLSDSVFYNKFTSSVEKCLIGHPCKKPNILFRKILCYLALDVVFALARWGIGGQAKRIISDGARHMVKYLVN